MVLREQLLAVAEELRRRKADGEFISLGAWGVTWDDLVELDYRDPHLRAYMAEVFLFWCRQGVDGFRCDRHRAAILRRHRRAQRH